MWDPLWVAKLLIVVIVDMSDMDAGSRDDNHDLRSNEIKIQYDFFWTATKIPNTARHPDMLDTFVWLFIAFIKCERYY